MLKVMLINPPQKYFSRSSSFGLHIPLGLLSIAASVKNICDVKIFDCLLKDFEVKTTEEFTLYGTSFEKIEIEIRKFAPDIVGITIPFSAQSENARIVAGITKKINPHTTVVFGGPHASIRYEELLKEENNCNFCVIGEGEETFYEFLKNYQSNSFPKNIDGLAYNINNEIRTNKSREPIKNLDNLPLPAYELISMDEYLTNPYLYVNRSPISKKSISLITSRGCPFNCVFCSIKLHMGKKYRYNSPDYVINHINFLIERYGVKNFHFEDDNISLNKSRFEQILDKILQNKIKIKWDTPNGIRADTLDFNLLKKIKCSGCKNLTIAIESGNQNVLNNIIKKNSSLEQIIKIVKFCKKLSINLNAFYVIGFPGETINNMNETIELALRLFRLYHVTPHLFCATPLYGTELYDKCVEEGLINKNLTDKELSTATGWYGNVLISTTDFSKEDVKKVAKNFQLSLQRAKLKYFIKHPIKMFNKITRPTLLKRYLKQLYLLTK